MIVPVILSGGSGTRLWPLSTAERPKQFISLVGDDSLFRQTLDRVSDRQAYAAPVVVANAAHMDMCLNELANRQGAQLILEPFARNTAAAIVMAAAAVQEEHGPDAIILVMPSDHLIGSAESFHAAVNVGAAAAACGRLVTFGVQPHGPETGYGYVEAGPALDEAPGTFRVASFTEKPELAKAMAMVATGRHYWNGGIFLFRVGTFLAEAERLASEIHRCALRSINAAETRGACILPSAKELLPCPNVSVDYAVMERSDCVAMVPLDAEWSDVGSWDAVASLALERDEDHTLLDCHNVFVQSGDIKVAAVGIRDLIIVGTGDRMMIVAKGQSQMVKQLMATATQGG